MNSKVLALLSCTTTDYERAEQLVCNAIAVEKALDLAADNGSVAYNELNYFLERNLQNFRVVEIKIGKGFADFRVRLKDPTPALLLTGDNLVGVEMQFIDGCISFGKLYPTTGGYSVLVKGK